MSAPSQLKDGSPPPGAQPNNTNANANANANANGHANNLSSSPQNGERRTSFGFLRRQKSTDAGKMLKKGRGASGAYNQQPSVPAVPPQLPTHSPLSKIPGFGGESPRPDSHRVNQSAHRAASGTFTNDHYQGGMYVPVPPVPFGSQGQENGDHVVDPYARTESMTHRGRYSYASSAISTGTGINSPRRVRRRKDPTPYK
jgi:hypothetical protein